MKKQLISVTLVLAFLLSLSMNAFASNTTTSEQQQIRSVAEKVQPTDYDIYEDFELLVSEFVEQGSSTDIGISGVANSLSDIAVVNKTNIVISDEYGNTLGEFHADGYTAEFVYEENIPHDSHTGKLTSEKQLKYIKDSEGLVQQFLLDGENIVNIRSIINGEVIQERQVNSALAINTGDVIEPSSTSSASTFYVYHSDGTRTDMSTLIDDIDFEFCTSCASVAEIQQFFEDKNSPLQYTIDNYIYDGESVYRAGTCDPAQYIHDICIRSLLSPKLILATLQKESSLVSSLHLNTPHSSRTFYFCMGNGSDSSASSTGFEHQIMGGAETLRYWYGQGSHYTYPYTYTHQGFRGYHGYGYSGYETSIVVTNAATFSLYKYTPYTCVNNQSTQSANVLFKDIFNNFLEDLPS